MFDDLGKRHPIACPKLINGGRGAGAFDDRRVVLVDRDPLGLAEIVDLDVLELDAEVLGDGTATLRETRSGVLIKADLTGASPGTHALHVHTTGKCEAPMFTTAGGHFAPGGTKHGLMAAEGPHAGDLPNIYVPADGRLSLEVLEMNVTLAEGPRSLLDAHGSAIVVHATADDYLTDPAGNAGGRIACGVVTK